MRRVLVTGGSGYVGSALVPVIAQRYSVRVLETMMFGNSIEGTPNVEFIKGDIRDRGAVSEALRDVTDVIHLAGIVTDELVDMNPILATEVNNTAMHQLCELAARGGIQRFIYASSSSVYGAQSEVCTEETIPNPMTAYAKTKLEGERILDDYARPTVDVTGFGKPEHSEVVFTDEGMTTVSVRCATLCGPAPRMRLDTIVNVFSKQAWFDGRITVHGGSQYRTNINVQDAVNFYAFLLDAPAERIAGRCFNLTHGNHTALALAQLVRDRALLFGRNVEIVVDLTKHDPRSYRMDASRMRQELGVRLRYTLADAIDANFRWFQDGNIKDPNDDLYYNNRRMAPLMRGER